MMSSVSERVSKIKLQLASKSPRRAELLSQIGVLFQTVSVDVDETLYELETVQAYVLRLAERKAEAGFAESPSLPTLGSDTAVYCQGEVLGKPKNKDDALRMLAVLSNGWHEVYTAVAICDGRGTASRLVCSQVQFREVSQGECEAYWHTGEPQDKAGAYAIQGKAAVFVEVLKGSYSAVMGLPLYETAALLSEYGVSVWEE